MKYILKELLELTKQKDYFKIKELLNSTDKKIKGQLFENYLAMLFKGNGFIATLNGKKGDGGADILLSKEDNPNKIIWVIQAKNIKTPLGENEIISEIIKYENKAKKIYTESAFKIISLNGYTQYEKDFSKLDISLEGFSYIKLLIDNYSPNINSNNKPMLPDLKPHNQWTYKEALELFKNHDRVSVPNATGTGKSYIISQFIYDYINKNKIILAPNKEILEQQMSLCPSSKANTIYMTYNKLINAINSDSFKSKEFDFIVLDELHRTGAKKWGEAVKKLLSYNPNAKVLALTATPIRNLDNNRNMINEFTEGVHTKPLTFFEAISRNIIENPVYVSALYDINNEIDKKVSRYNNLNTQTKDIISKIKTSFDNSDYLSDTIKKYAPKNINGLRFIVFCEDSNHLYDMQPKVLNWFAKAYGKGNRLKPFTLLSELADNDKELTDFNSISKDIKIMFCVNKLNEGLHLKSGINGCVLLRKTNSTICYMQQIGRVFDCSKKIKNPVIFDFVNNIDNIQGKNFTNELNKSNLKLNSFRKNLGLEEINIEPYSYIELPNVLEKIKELDSMMFSSWNKYYNILLSYKNYAENIVNKVYGHYKKRTKIANISWIKEEDKFIVTVLENPKSYTKRIKDRMYNEMPLFNQYSISIEELYLWCEHQEELYFNGGLSDEQCKMLLKLDFANLVKTTKRNNYNLWQYNFEHCSKLLIEEHIKFISSVHDFGNNTSGLPHLIQDDIVGEFEDFLFTKVPQKIFNTDVKADVFLYTHLSPMKWILNELRMYISSDDDVYSKEQEKSMFYLLKKLNMPHSILLKNWKTIEYEIETIFNLAYMYIQYYELIKYSDRSYFGMFSYLSKEYYEDLEDNIESYPLKNSLYFNTSFTPSTMKEKTIRRYDLFNILYDATKRTLYSDKETINFAILKNLNKADFFLVRNLVLDSLFNGNFNWFSNEFLKFLKEIDPEYRFIN